MGIDKVESSASSPVDIDHGLSLSFHRPSRFIGDRIEAGGKHVQNGGYLHAGDIIFSSFNCGVELIDRWVHERAAQCGEQRTAVLYASLTANGEFAGFYTLSSFSVSRESVAGGWLKRNSPEQLPVVLLGMLGVNREFQGLGLGWRLLEDAFLRSRQVSQHLGARALVVEPYDDNARNFYLHFGFQPLRTLDGHSRRLYARLNTPSGTDVL